MSHDRSISFTYDQRRLDLKISSGVPPSTMGSGKGAFTAIPIIPDGISKLYCCRTMLSSRAHTARPRAISPAETFMDCRAPMVAPHRWARELARADSTGLGVP